ncbi:PIN-like domain-containing protein [Cronobacter sakazakii]|uniref:PIN-like domain-containing protein n=1 Tax=Cronobacter sakazakii TaxID=28141 RepID=UPI0009BA173D|nr:PIN-like domain-containing protein [Cronobacter sakazakii]MCZ6132160.1 PIN-like domain-containing protein [Cronobacter sakazakii]MCZ6139917.1 PIN-like domain-containing protein [Cronobacter sakazakii]PUX81479.1 hypothetical protein BTK64_19935 [Cronobacter sakazakii]
MRGSFKGFYGASEDTIGKVYTSEDTTFIFDANILLTLYRCEEETRNRFFDVWEKIQNKCWFPYHVCLEYQRNRLKVIHDSQSDLEGITSTIDESLTKLKKEIMSGGSAVTISRYTILRADLDELFTTLIKTATDFSKNHILTRKENINFLESHDVIRDKIDALVEGRIGPAPTDQKDIEKLNAEGKIRYEFKIGPGYEDIKKNDEKYSYNGIRYSSIYGDFYVWSQILEYVDQNKGKNIVYVTNDVKSDFFYKVGGKIRGPNESLVTEMKGKGAAEFLLHNIHAFLHHANTHLNAKMDESTIDELSNASVTDISYTPSQIVNSDFHEHLAKTSINKMRLANIFRALGRKHEDLLSELKEITEKEYDGISVLENLKLIDKKEELEKQITQIENQLSIVIKELEGDPPKYSPGNIWRQYYSKDIV